MQEWILGLSVVTQQVADHLFSGVVKGVYMKYLAVLVGVGLAYMLWVLGWGPFAETGPTQVGVAGVVAGLGSNIADAIVGRFFPKVKEATLSKALGLALNHRANGPPIPPSPKPWR